MPSSSGSEPDEVLVLRALRGDLRGFDGLVARYRGAAFVIAQRILPAREDVEDTVQEAFLKAFRALPALRTPHRFPFWLYTIVRRTAYRRRQQADARADDVPLDTIPGLPALDPPPDLQLERRLQATALSRALTSLPEEYVVPLALHYFHHMRLRHIARFLGISLPLVKWRLHRGRSLLRDLLSQRETQGGNEDDGDRSRAHPRSTQGPR